VRIFEIEKREKPKMDEGLRGLKKGVDTQSIFFAKTGVHGEEGGFSEKGNTVWGFGAVGKGGGTKKGILARSKKKKDRVEGGRRRAGKEKNSILPRKMVWGSRKSF